MKKVILVSAAFAFAWCGIGLFSPNAYAATQTCTWTGAGGDGKFSTATNWSNCGGIVPQEFDILKFDTTPLSGAVALTNDLPGLEVGGVQATGSNNGSYTITGNDLLLAGDLSSDGSGNVELLVNTTLAQDISLKHTGSGYGYIRLSTVNMAQQTSTTGTMNLNGHNLTIDGSNSFLSKLTGSGNVHAINGGNFMLAFNTQSPSWTGAVTVGSDSYMSIAPSQISSLNPITVSSGGGLGFCAFNGADFANPITVGGSGALAAGSNVKCAQWGSVGGAGFLSLASVNLTGPLVLTANTTVVGSGELKVSGSLSGNFSLAMAGSQDGKVTIASSNNTSGAQNGTQVSAGVTTTYAGEKPTDFISIATIDTGILNGTYLSADVNGTFKGNGTITGGIWVYASGRIAPGNSPGCITSDTLDIAGEYQFDIGGTTPCTGYDQLKVLNAAVASTAVTLNNTSSVLTTSRYNGYTPKQGDVFIIIDQAGTAAVSGAFKGLPEGAAFSQNGVTFKISYVGGDGNDVTLTVMNQPTAPDTGVLILRSSPVMIAAGTILAALTLLGLAKLSKARR